MAVIGLVVPVLLALSPSQSITSHAHARIEAALKQADAQVNASAGASTARNGALSLQSHARRPMTWNGRSMSQALAAASAAGPEARRGTSPLSVPDGFGGQYMLWADPRDGTFDLFVLRVTNAGAPAPGWPADGVIVCNAPGQQIEAALFPDGANGVIVGWLDGRDDFLFADVYVQRVNSSGVLQWGGSAEGVKVLDGTADVGEVSAAPDGASGLVVGWSEGPQGDTDVYATRVTSAGAIATGWVGGVLVCDEVSAQDVVVITGDGAGGALLAWEDDRELSVSHVYAQHVSPAGAPQWAANGIQIDASTVSATEPAVALLSSGDPFIAWLDYDAGQVFAQKLDWLGDEQWVSDAILHTGGGNPGAFAGDMLPLGDNSDGAIVSWRSSVASVVGLHAQRVSAAGAILWGANGLSIVNNSASVPSEFDMVGDGANGAYFAWQDYRGGSSYDIYAQRATAAGGVSWAVNGVPVGVAAETQDLPSVAPDGAGGVLVSWLDSRTGDMEIYSQRLNSAGVPQLALNGVAAFNNPGVQYFPLALQASDGGLLLAWEEKRNGEYDIRARKLNADGSPAGSATLVSNAAGHQRIRGFLDDGAGGGIVTWVDQDTERPYAQRIDGSANPLWALNGVLAIPALQFETNVQFVTDGSGGVIFAWAGFNGTDYDIQAQRIDAAGNYPWGASGVNVCTDPSSQSSSVVASDGAGGAIIAWSDNRNPTRDIFAQRINSSGVAQWAANGVLISSFASPFSFADPTRATSAPSNGAIFLIHEFQFDFLTFQITSGLYAQKVNSAGVTQWGASGQTIFDHLGIAAVEQVIEDGFGGAFVGWCDDRGSPFDVYCQRINSGGGVTWGPNGGVVCNAPSWQYLGGMTKLSDTSVIFSWTDERLGLPDIYAHRMTNAGADVWAPDGVVVSDAGRGQYGAALAPWKTATPERLYLAWTDSRAGSLRHAFAERLDFNGVSQWTLDGVTSTQMALASAVADRERVRLTWYGTESVAATVYRRQENVDWASLASVMSDGTGKIVFEDRDIEPGARYGYRLGVREGSAEVFLGETWIDVPNDLVLALHGLSPNPAVGDMVVAFTLPSGSAAKLELLDLAGRRVQQRELVGLGPGRHTLRLDGTRPSPGVYFLRLTQNRKSVTTRAAIID